MVSSTGLGKVSNVLVPTVLGITGHTIRVRAWQVGQMSFPSANFNNALQLTETTLRCHFTFSYMLLALNCQSLHSPPPTGSGTGMFSF